MEFELYKSDKDNQWRWRLVASNGKTVADSSEGYHNKLDCQNELIQVIHFIAKKLATADSVNELFKMLVKESQS